MNLFILFDDAIKSAQAHGDKHVIKMILETCQMLYTAHWTAHYPELIVKSKKNLPLPPSLEEAPKKKDSETRGYAHCHINHPCTKWIRKSLENYIFACNLGIALAEEYKYRWPQKNRPHSCEGHVRWLKENPPDLPSLGQTPFAIAMDDKYKIGENAIESYRNYYQTAKKEKGIISYTRRKKPSFLL